MEIQIFIGVHFTQQLKQLYPLHSAHFLSLEKHHNEDYLGFFISDNIITMDHLEQQKKVLISELEALFNQTQSLWPHFSFAVFPKVVIGNFYKYTPNPG